MADSRREVDGDRARAHLLSELKTFMAQADKEAISGTLGDIDPDKCLRITVTVARMRAHYLAKAVQLAEYDGHNLPSEEDISSLRRAREAYEEGVKAYTALERAIERYYLELTD